MSLYHKHRPATLKEFRGNQAEVASLTREMAKPNDERAHYYLFTGLSGGGKTTLARILATSLQINPTDTIELNGADIGKADEARQLAGELGYYPMSGNAKLYIIDEIHKATSAWWDIMLKPLEDTPKHVYIVLCTSEAHKVPKAAFNRAFHIEVKPLTNKQMFALLDDVAIAENLTIPEDHLLAVVEASAGSSRHGLQLLEKIIPAKDLKAVHSLLAVPVECDDNADVKELCQGMMNGKGFAHCAGILAKMKNMEPETIRRGVIGYLGAVALNSRNKDLAQIVGIWSEHTTYDSGFPMLVGLLASTT